MSKPEIHDLFGAHAYFGWGWKGFGFGQLSFGLCDDGSITCMNEHMDRETVRKILHAFADHIADNAVLDNEREP